MKRDNLKDKSMFFMEIDEDNLVRAKAVHDLMYEQLRLAKND